MNINKIIFYTSFEVIVLTTILLLTYFVWNTFEIDKNAQIAYYYTNPSKYLSLKVESNIKLLSPQKNDEAINDNNKIELKINNISLIPKKYYIFMTIQNTHDLDINYLNLNINNQTYKTSDLKQFIKKENTYYLLLEEIIKPENTDTHNLYFWLSEETPDEEQNKELRFEFNIKEV